jgi:hypothetical protein
VFGILNNQGSSSSEGEAPESDAEEATGGSDDDGNTMTTASASADAESKGDASKHEEPSTIVRKRSQSILKKKSSFHTASPEKSSNPRIQFAENLEQVRIIAPVATAGTPRQEVPGGREQGEDDRPESSSGGDQGGSSSDDEEGEGEDGFAPDDNEIDEELSERDSNDWVDALEDRSSINRTIQSLSRLIVRYRTKIVQNGPYIRESASQDDLATMADWRKRVSVSEHQLEKLRHKLEQMDKAAAMIDGSSDGAHRREMSQAAPIAGEAALAGGADSESSLSSDEDGDIDDLMYTTKPAPDMLTGQQQQQQQQRQNSIKERNGGKDGAISHAAHAAESVVPPLVPAAAAGSVVLSAASEELTQEREMLMQTAERVKRIWLDAQATELHKKKRHSQPGGAHKRRRSVHDLEGELRAGASKLEELSIAVTSVQRGVETRERRIGHQSIITASEVALDAASESTGMLRGYLPTLSIPSVSSFTGWMPSFSGMTAAQGAKQRDDPRETNAQALSASPSDRKIHAGSPKKQPTSPGSTGGVDDVGSYVGLQRLLVELISENVKMRTQLNHYSEALLMPALEKDKEFRRQFEEAEVEAKSRMKAESNRGEEEAADEEDEENEEQHHRSLSRKGKKQKKKKKKRDKNVHKRGEENIVSKEGRVEESNTESSARMAAIRQQIKEEEDRLRIVLMREEAEKRRAEQDRAALTSSEEDGVSD